MGPSGVGKSTIIEEILQLDKRFVSVPTYTTRNLRVNEKNKISISSQQIFAMRDLNKLLEINELYGNQYATPVSPIADAFARNKFPVLDWPISRLEIMKKAFPEKLFVVYVSPPSIEILERRLLNDVRDSDNIRLQVAREELEAYWSGHYVNLYDFDIVSEENHQMKTAEAILNAYLLSSVTLE